ncbi:DUF3291 domain-containing protein [Sphingomonas sp. Leaf38]|uniref:DUF3291 domain-containing protein n=1 Tax=Sphingomonas sp. Leaf38 TaxID=1736217 RepID=UPI0006F44C55|nr:DUF3291 domain-containing protein [Sphingomonas sp. Leaf38]KQN29563.1 hypothetical protein ASE88_11740 [Sphingomonas sp. Leaf38]
MMFISVTRLRVRSLRFMPVFIVQLLGTNGQVRRADGFVTGSLLPDRRLTFWTMTLWRDQTAMRHYVTHGSHLQAMPKLLHWCDEASIVHWDQPDRILPSWDEADRRMRADGRPSKVLHPSVDHQALDFRPPRITRATPIAPAP